MEKILEVSHNSGQVVEGGPQGRAVGRPWLSQLCLEEPVVFCGLPLPAGLIPFTDLVCSMEQTHSDVTKRILLIRKGRARNKGRM